MQISLLERVNHASSTKSIRHLTPSTVQRIHQLIPTLKEPVFVYKDIVKIKKSLRVTLEPYDYQLEYAVLVAAEELMTNALQYAGNGLFSLYMNKNHLYVSVEDQGPGLDYSILIEAINSPGFGGPHTLGNGLHRTFIASKKLAFFNQANLTAFIAIFSMES